MTYNASEIAKYIIYFGNQKGIKITNLKLQKLLYFLWVDFYKQTGDNLFNNEICAWKLGTVVPDVYRTYSIYGGEPLFCKEPVNLCPEDEFVLERSLNDYIQLSASTLVNKSHEPGSPWDRVYRNGCGDRSVIPFDLIKRRVRGS